MTKDTMTVSQLIKKLKRCPKDLPVYLEGCDCYGDLVGVQIVTEGRPEPTGEDTSVMKSHPVSVALRRDDGVDNGDEKGLV